MDIDIDEPKVRFHSDDLENYFYSGFLRDYSSLLSEDWNGKVLQPYLDFDKIYLIFYKKFPVASDWFFTEN